MVPLFTLIYPEWPLSQVVATSVATSLGLTFINSLFFFFKGRLRLSMVKPFASLLLPLVLGAWLTSQWSLSYKPFVFHYLLYGVLLLLAWHLLFPALSPLKSLLDPKNLLSPPPATFASFSSSFSSQKKRRWAGLPSLPSLPSFLPLLPYLGCGLLAGGFLATTGVGAGLILSAFLWSLVKTQPRPSATSSSLSPLKPEHISPLVNVLVALAAFFSCLSFMGGELVDPEERKRTLWQWGWIHGDIALITLLGACSSLPLSMRWQGRLSPQQCQKGLAFFLLLTLVLMGWSEIK